MEGFGAWTIWMDCVYETICGLEKDRQRTQSGYSNQVSEVGSWAMRKQWGRWDRWGDYG